MKRSTKLVMVLSVLAVILGFTFKADFGLGFWFVMCFGGASVFMLAPLNEL